jgi:hypothetical protein
MEQCMAFAPMESRAEMAEEIAFLAESEATFRDQAFDAKSRKEMSFRNYQRRSSRNVPKP